MDRKRSLPAYRALDLLLFSIILVLFESIIVKVSAGSRFSDQAYTVSLAAAITGIVYMRWGAWGAIHAFFSGFIFCFMQKAAVQQYIIYAGGNLLSLAALPIYKKLGRERIRADKFLFIPVSLIVLVLMQTGRALAALILGAPVSALVLFYTTDCLSALFTLLIIWIARRQDGLYEDQIHYLKRIQAEIKQEEETRESN